MPNSIEVEQAVLGALLLSREKYPEVDALISSVDFESDVHKEIYECIKELADQDKAIDHITVSKLLDRKKFSQENWRSRLFKRIANYSNFSVECR